MITVHNSAGAADHGTGRIVLAVGGLSALLASACCLGPLLLLAVGVSGVWIGHLAALERYRPTFIGAAFVALYVAYRRIYRPEACAPDALCAVPSVRQSYKVLFWIVAALLGIALAFPLVAPLFY